MHITTLILFCVPKTKNPKVKRNRIIIVTNYHWGVFGFCIISFYDEILTTQKIEGPRWDLVIDLVEVIVAGFATIWHGN